MSSRPTVQRESVAEIVIDLDGTRADATVIRSARRRRSIAISVEARVVRVRVPMRATRGQIEEAVHKHRAWILARLAAPVATALLPQFLTGETVQFRGGHLTLDVREVRARRVVVRQEGESLRVEVPSAFSDDDRAKAISAAITSWYRDQAKVLFWDLVPTWSAASGLVPKAVQVRDQRRRWGSCSPDGTLRFNWRLVMVEPALAEYVVVHELAHLRHRNHQAEFWAEVAALMPDHLARRKRLTAIGRGLLQ